VINKFQYIGHSTIIFETSNSKKIIIDPWLKDNPSCLQEFKDLVDFDLVILTHGHFDHTGSCLEILNNSNAKLLATFELAGLIKDEGIAEERIIYMNKGGNIIFEDLVISLTHAIHSNSYTNSESKTFYAGEACGVVIKDKTNSFYCAGDTSLFSDMKLIKERFDVNYGFLPIGDVFTMGPADAAYAASNLLSLDFAIPIHYDTFEQLTGSVDIFINELEKTNTKALILKPGETFKIGN